jgi:predicted phosphodiesterase
MDQMMINVLYIGDMHGAWHRAIETLNSVVSDCKDRGYRIDRIVQVGDFGFWPRLEKMPGMEIDLGIPFYFIDGNHDDHDILNVMVENNSPFPHHKYKGVKYIERCTIMDNVFHLGGAESIDKHMRTYGVDWSPMENIRSSDYYKAVSHDQKCDVMVCHETSDAGFNILMADKSMSKDTPDGKSNRSIISALIDHFDAKMLVHGHYHHHKIYDVDGVQHISLARCDNEEGSIRGVGALVSNGGEIIHVT